MTCEFCGDTPCIWDINKNEIDRRVEAVYSNLLVSDKYKSDLDYADEINRACRKHAFKAMAYIRHGHLGRGIRVQHSKCVVCGIREMWIDRKGNFVGYHSS